jgi:hypothetical protein
MKLLATCRGSRLLIALCRETGVPPFPPYFATGKADIDSLRIAERHQLKALAAYLLEDWGERFVKICLAGRVWSSTLLRDFESAPFWYWNIIRAHLYRASHHATTAEITAAIAHINLSGGVAYQKAISDLLGVQNVFRKRKTLANFSRSTVGRAIVKVAKVK